jgi:hypothetical protein
VSSGVFILSAVIQCSIQLRGLYALGALRSAPGAVWVIMLWEPMPVAFFIMLCWFTSFSFAKFLLVLQLRSFWFGAVTRLLTLSAFSLSLYVGYDITSSPSDLGELWVGSVSFLLYKSYNPRNRRNHHTHFSTGGHPWLEGEY